MSARSNISTIRWFQFRLRFLIVVVPLGGLVLCLPLAEIKRLNRDTEFRRALDQWLPGRLESQKEDSLLAQSVARNISITDLPRAVRNRCSINGDLVFVSSLSHGLQFPDHYLFCLSVDRRIVGAVTLHRKSQSGQIQEIDPKVIQVRDFMLDLSPNLKPDRVNHVLEEQGFWPAHPVRTHRKHRNRKRRFSRTLGNSLILVTYGRWSPSNPRTFAHPPPDIWGGYIAPSRYAGTSMNDWQRL